WPGKIKPGSISNGIVQHHDWLPTFLAIAGAPDVVEKLKTGYQAIGRTYKNHIDGFNLVPYLTGEEKECPRNFFFYISDDGDVQGFSDHPEAEHLHRRRRPAEDERSAQRSELTRLRGLWIRRTPVQINQATQGETLAEARSPPGRKPAEGMVWIPAGTFLMGS